jgi:hypothetical protein
MTSVHIRPATAHTNTTAQKLYESLGWTLDTVFRAYNKRISA